MGVRLATPQGAGVTGLNPGKRTREFNQNAVLNVTDPAASKEFGKRSPVKSWEVVVLPPTPRQTKGLVNILSFSSDEAITSSEEDAFGWGLYAKQIATLIEEAHLMGGPRSHSSTGSAR